MIWPRRWYDHVHDHVGGRALHSETLSFSALLSFSNNTADLEKSFEVVDLSKSHCDQNHSLKEGPHDNPGVCVVVDVSVDSVSDLHVLLFMFNPGQ